MSRRLKINFHTVGVLAFQGDFAEHHAILRKLKVASIDVRNLTDLAQVDALIIPGGESTVMAKFLEESRVGKEIIRRARIPSSLAPLQTRLRQGNVGQEAEGKNKTHASTSLTIFGTCAGAILLARKATGKNAPRTLGLIDITIDRNAYGTQTDSFEAKLKVRGMKKTVPASFIRAPKITRVGKGVEVLAEHDGVPVLVRQGNVMVATFHPEVRGETGVHELFLSL